MSATLTVPAGFVPYLRSGLFGEWGIAASELAVLADDFGSNASDGAYSEPLQTFLTIWTLLGEVGLKDIDGQGDVVINLGVNGAHVVKGLKHEHSALLNQLDQLPRNTRKAIRAAASAKVAEFGEFVSAVDARVNRLHSRQHQSSSALPEHSRTPLRARPPQARRSPAGEATTRADDPQKR
jgi:hypothetical protein